MWQPVRKESTQPLQASVPQKVLHAVYSALVCGGPTHCGVWRDGASQLDMPVLSKCTTNATWVVCDEVGSHRSWSCISLVRWEVPWGCRALRVFLCCSVVHARGVCVTNRPRSQWLVNHRLPRQSIGPLPRRPHPHCLPVLFDRALPRYIRERDQLK